MAIAHAILFLCSSHFINIYISRFSRQKKSPKGNNNLVPSYSRSRPNKAISICRTAHGTYIKWYLSTRCALQLCIFKTNPHNTFFFRNDFYIIFIEISGSTSSCFYNSLRPNFETIR